MSARVWPRIVGLGIAYFVIGTVTAALSRGAPSHELQLVWRWVAWLLSAVVFAAHIWYERYRAGGAPVRTAQRNALAVAVGGFLLAVAATVHTLSLGRARVAPQLIALVVWPVLLAVPAFLVSWAAAAFLPRKVDS